MQPRKHLSWSGLAWLAALGAAGSAWALPSGIEVLAVSGQAVDGGPPGATHNTLGLPGIDDFGPYYFGLYNASINPVSFVNAIFATDPAGDRYIKLQTASPSVDLNFDSSTYVMSRASQLLVVGSDLAVGGGAQAVFRENPTSGGFDVFGQLDTVAPSTATPGALFEDEQQSLMITASGEIAFNNNLQVATAGVTTENDLGIWWTLPSGSLDIVVQEGDPLPGLPGQTVSPPFILDLSEAGALINSTAKVFFPAVGAPRLVAAIGEPFPDDAGEDFNELFLPRLNDAGDIYFVGSGAVSGSHLFGPDGQNGLIRWVSEGDAATEAGVGFYFQDFAAGSLADLSVNEAGQVLFFATLGSPGQGFRDSLWIANGPGDVELVAQAFFTAQIPTYNAGPVDCRFFDKFGLLNDLGEVAFECAGIGAERSLLYASSTGEVALVIQSGQEWELEPGISSPVLSWDVDDGIQGANASRPTSGLGDRGLVFRARLDQGATTALFFVPDPELVPEPAAEVGMLAALLACFVLRARKLASFGDG